jgi:hypothetical protein
VRAAAILALFVRPDTVDTSTLFNPLLILAVFLIGTGYILFIQTITVWSKQLYPQDSRGQFEGIRILFFVSDPDDHCAADLQPDHTGKRKVY